LSYICSYSCFSFNPSLSTNAISELTIPSHSSIFKLNKVSPHRINGVNQENTNALEVPRYLSYP
jgi:hypothetical protein